MGFKFYCPECHNSIVVKYLNPGDQFTCPHCQTDITVPSNLQASDESSTIIEKHKFKPVLAPDTSKVKSENIAIENYMYKESNIYTKEKIVLAAIIGGALATTFTMYSNYKKLGKNEYATRALFIGILITLLLFGQTMFYPVNDRTFDKVVRTVIVLFSYLFAYLFQAKYVKIHIANKGKLAKWYEAIGIGFAALVVSLVILLPFALIMPPMEGEELRAGKYNNSVFYGDNVTEVEAHQFAEYLLEIGYLEAADGLYCKVEKDKNGYRLLMPVDREYWDDGGIIKTYENIGKFFNLVYDENTVTIILFEDSILGTYEKEL